MNLVFLLTENYLDRARPFMQSLGKLTRTDCIGITLDFDIGKRRESMDPEYNIDFYSMPRHWSESSTGIMQHGRWLDAFANVRDDDLFLLSDADIIIQRDFTDAERRRLQSLDAQSFAAGWNACPGDNLAEEARRIGMTDMSLFGTEAELAAIPCYNTGVLAMRGIAWKRLRDLYESRCERFYGLTKNRSRGQWLMCYCLHRLGLKADILPFSLHTHGHFGVPFGSNLRSGVLYYGDDVVMFRHAIG